MLNLTLTLHACKIDVSFVFFCFNSNQAPEAAGDVTWSDHVSQTENNSWKLQLSVRRDSEYH